MIDFDYNSNTLCNTKLWSEECGVNFEKQLYHSTFWSEYYDFESTVRLYKNDFQNLVLKET